MGRYLKRGFATWFLLLPIAFVNGWLREAVLAPAVGTTWAQQASALMLSTAILVVAFFTIRWMGPDSITEAALIGAAWLLLTVAFEFGFGRLSGSSWSELLAAYDVSNGSLWILVLLMTAVAPALTASARGVYAESAWRSS